MRTAFRPFILAAAFCAATTLLTGCAHGPTAIDGQTSNLQNEKIAPYHARFGRSRPLVAIVGDNDSSELSDYVVPYGILSQSGVADVKALSTRAGTIKTVTDMGKPGFQIEPEATIVQFDAQFPDGADYIVVPATRSTPALSTWITQQTQKGATIVSICNGAMVVAKSGAMDGHRATAHWSTEDDRLQKQPQIHWVKNARYVADGNWVSSSGVSASIPTSVALVEAIAGHDRAVQFAQELGVEDWTAKHNSDAFQPQLGVNLMAYAQAVYTNHWFHKTDRIGVTATAGVNEVALALMVDAYSTTGRSQAFVVSQSTAPLRTQHGLVLIPDIASETTDASGKLDRMLSAPDGTPPGKVFDKLLNGISDLYGRTNAHAVALLMEYPGLQD